MLSFELACSSLLKGPAECKLHWKLFPYASKGIEMNPCLQLLAHLSQSVLDLAKRRLLVEDLSASLDSSSSEKVEYIPKFLIAAPSSQARFS